MKQTQFTTTQNVLNPNGTPNPGWATHGILRYDRRAIRAPFYRIKEWDWYQVNSPEIAVQFTFGHASYAGQIGINMFNFKTGEKIFNKDAILVLPFSSLNLSASADTNSTIVYNKKDMYLRLATKDNVRTIQCRTEGFETEFVLKQQNPHALVINVPFDEKSTAFYYNHKINCMSAEGIAVVGGKEYAFSSDTSWGLLDWGRGVWPFHGEWYWSNAAGRLNGEIFGINLGCGFGNTDTATENCIFYKDKIHKLGKVNFTLGEKYHDTWHLQDEDDRLDLALKPTYDRTTQIKLLWVNNSCHQMFGSFSGSVVLDSGETLHVENIIGFAEHAINNW